MATMYTWDPITGTYVLSADQSFGVTTDQPDYSPGQTVHFEALRQIPKLRAGAHDTLTTRERQIVLVLSEGKSNKEIARQLRLTEGTVKVHLHRIYGKLGIANRTVLAILAHTKTLDAA